LIEAKMLTWFYAIKINLPLFSFTKDKKFPPNSFSNQEIEKGFENFV